MSDLQISALLAALCLPYLVWVNLRAWRNNELFLDDDIGKITAHYTKANHPIQYWAVLLFNVGLILVFVGVILWWWFTRGQISN